jgi:predicted transcriptional regulator
MEVQNTVKVYVDTHDNITRTGLMKYYFPLLRNMMKNKTMSQLFVINNTTPVGYSETIGDDVINATQSTIVLEI